MKLQQLLIIAANSEGLKEDYGGDHHELLNDLIAFTPAGADAGYWYNQVNRVPFDLSKQMEGCYFVFDTCPHYPGAKLYSFDDLSAVQRHLISASSLLNSFTGATLVFNMEIELKFRILYTDNHGKIVAFDKAKQDSFDTAYTQPRVEWLNKG